MPIINADKATIVQQEQRSGYLLPLILVTSLFFLWGLAYGLLDVLNKHFQEVLNVTKQRSTLLQAAYFGAYFLMAIPAGLFMEKWGYKKGIIAGLLLYATGALLFYPAASLADFSFFLLSLFILASGLTFMETAANPYITVLGKPESASWRLNLSQSFNGVGAFLGPIIGARFFFGGLEGEGQLDSVKFVYIAISGIVLLFAVLFFKTDLPEIKTTAENDKTQTDKKLFQHKHFVFAVIAQFFYVAAQVGIAALFINYCTEQGGIPNNEAAYLLSAGLVLFTVGRFTGTALMRVIPSHRLLALYAAINMICSLVIITQPGKIGIYALVATFFFNSIMFPTIFALGLTDLGKHTKKASSFIIMAIVGGALVPYVMGSFQSTADAFIVPMICFAVVLAFGIYGYKQR
jgi:FHS family L-fucose permease-like MFS transporter